MPRTRILLLVPVDAESVAAFEAHGATFPPDVAPGSPAEVNFDSLGIPALDGLCERLSAGRTPYVVLSAARFDPSMCLPSPNLVRIECPAAALEARQFILPFRFEQPGFDVRTLIAAGLSDAESRRVLDLFEIHTDASLAA